MQIALVFPSHLQGVPAQSEPHPRRNFRGLFPFVYADVHFECFVVKPHFALPLHSSLIGWSSVRSDTMTCLFHARYRALGHWVLDNWMNAADRHGKENDQLAVLGIWSVWLIFFTKLMPVSAVFSAIMWLSFSGISTCTNVFPCLVESRSIKQSLETKSTWQAWWR